MIRYRVEIEAIANDPAPPTFVNTLEAMERAGRDYRQATSLMGIFTSTMNDAAMKAVQRDAAPKLAAFRDQILHNRALFDRIRAVYDARDSSGLNDEQQRLAKVTYERFARQGAALNEAQKHRLAEINQRLAVLYTSFSQNILGDEEGQALVLESEADLAGLPADLIEAAAAAAKQRGLKGWVIANTRSSMEPFNDLLRSPGPAGEGAGPLGRPGRFRRAPTTTHANIAEILKLRVEKAALLGHDSFAHWITVRPDGQTSRSRDGAPAPGLEAGRRQGRPGSAGDAGDRRRPGLQRADRAVGLPLLFGKGAAGEIRSQQRGDQTLSATRQAARRACSGRPASCSTWPSPSFTTCRSITRTWRSMR